MANPNDGKLEKGAKCNNTLAVQNALNLARPFERSLKNFAPLVCDGVFGTETQKAVSRFQEALRLKSIDGIVGNETGPQLFQMGRLVTSIAVHGLGRAPKLSGSGPALPPGTKLLPDSPGALANTALAFGRSKVIDAFMNSARVNGFGLKMPKLTLSPEGLARSAFAANGIGTQLLEQIPIVGVLPQFFDKTKAVSVAFTSQVSSLEGFSVSWAKPIFQPVRGPSFQTTNKIGKGPNGIQINVQTMWLPLGDAAWTFKDVVRLKLTPEISTSVTAPLNLGKGTIDFNAHATLDAEVTVRPIDVKVHTPLVDLQGVELFVRGGVGGYAHARLSPALGTAEFNGKFGFEATGGITSFWEIPRRK